MRVRTFLLAFIGFLYYASPAWSSDLVIQPHEKTVEIGDSSQFFQLSTKGDYKNESKEIFVQLIVNHDDIIEVSPNNLTISTSSSSGPWNITIRTHHIGHAQVITNVTPSGVINDENGFIDIKVELLSELGIISFGVGWIYFVAWSISFYPQILENWRRKSVVGLNFDFLALNFIGFTLYSLFNCGLFWSKLMEKQYHSRYPRSANPVLLNDVVFSLHATIATLFCIFQCFIYEQGGQTISITARFLIGGFCLIVAATAICATFNVFLWLDFLYCCSYIKLTITLIKYIPQAYMNYKRKSTIGWSIGNIVLDFTGGILSMLQMVINAYNFDDWASIFGDITKFGLGLFSVVFDIFFMIQHFILYRNPVNSYEELPGENFPELEPETNRENHSSPVEA